MVIFGTAKVSKQTKLYLPNNDKYHIGDFCLVTVPQLSIAEGSQINAGSRILGRERVTIGRYSVVSYNCTLMTTTDTPNEALASDYLPEEKRRLKSAPIEIGEHCFIGANTIVMPGVTIHDGSVIGANSYIDKDVKGWTIYVPNHKPKRRPKLTL